MDSSISYRRIGFANSNTRSFSVDTENFGNLSLGVSREFEHLIIGAGIAYENVPIITGLSFTSIAISSLSILSPYITAEWHALSWGKTDIALEFLAYSNISSTTKGLEGGFDAQIALELNRNLSERLSYSLVPFVRQGVKSTETVEHSDLDLGIKLLMILD